MGRQTRFYAHPDDYAGMAEGLRSQEAVVIDRRSSTGEPVIRDITDAHGSIDVFLTHRRYLRALHPRYSEHQKTWIYSVLDDPLVELDVPRPHEGVLRPGRVYFNPRTVFESELYDKPQEFIAFAEQVRRWLRRWCKKREELLLAPSLVARFDRGELARKDIQNELELMS